MSLHSSPNDQMLWALDSRWNVHVRAGITEEMPVGTDWEHVPGRDEAGGSRLSPHTGPWSVRQAVPHAATLSPLRCCAEAGDRQATSGTFLV